MKKAIFLGMLSLLSWYGCKEEGRIDIINEDAPAPLPLTEVTVTPRHGGAVLRYQIPKDENLLCVKAVYEINPGQFNETKASIYLDSLVLKGFGSTNTTPVKVYTVGRNGKESEPYIVDVTPLTPVVDVVSSSFEVKRAIGGVKIVYEKNDSKENLTYVLLTWSDRNHKWEEVRKFYSSLESGSFTQRGMEAVETNVGVYVTDRWGNASDTVETMVTPVFEEEIPKPFAHKEVAGDDWTPGSNVMTIDKLWDGMYHDFSCIYATSKTTPLPQSFTIDLKHKVELTRVVEHQRIQYAYLDTSVKEFELFGTCVDMPNGDTNHPDWIKLGRFSSYQPSGQTGNPTEEDIHYANVEGESFEFLDENGDPKPTPPIRYLRWRTYETWNGATERGEVIIAELDIYGKIVDD